MMEMVNHYVDAFVARVMEYGYTALHFLLCALVIVLGMILVIRFARNWVQRGVIAAVCASLVAAAPWICRELLMPFCGKLLTSVLTVSVYLIIGAAPILLLAGWIWKTFTRHL